MTDETKQSIQTIVTIMIILLAIVVPVGNWLNSNETIVIAKEPTQNNDPTEVQGVTAGVGEHGSAEVSAVTPTFDNEIDEYIYQVYGDDYDKAMLVLKGIDGKCGGENRGLRPEAVNVNKDGSRDFSIFQVNDYYHPVYELNLDTNWKANIDYSYRMFINDGHTFSKRWVAGKCLASYGYEI